MKKFGLRIMVPLILFCEQGIIRADSYESSTKVGQLTGALVEKLKTERKTEAQKLDKKDAEDFVRKLGEDAFEIIRTKDVNSAEVRKGFEFLLKSRFGLMSIAGFALGPSFRNLSKEEKQRVAEGYLLKDLYDQFLSKFADYKTSTFTVTGSKEKSLRHIEVESVLTAKQTQKIVWSVYLSKGSVKVYDVIIDEVSASNV